MCTAAFFKFIAMKDELINSIQPNCLLPFQLMTIWLDNVVLINDPTGAVRQQIKTGLRSNGSLTQASWELLINNVVLEQNPPINNAVALQWVQAQGYPTCTQLKIFINSFAIGAMNYFNVNTPAVNLVELDIKTTYVKDAGNKRGDKHIYHVVGGKNFLIRSFFMHLYIQNWEYIKDAQPKLVLERYLPKRKNAGTTYVIRKSGYKRDKRLSILGNVVNGWGGTPITVTQTNLYRPNFIPLTGKKQVLDIYAENYVRNQLGNKEFKFISGNTNVMNTERYNIKIPMRARICIKCNGKEFFSQPLIYFSIFAKVNSTQQVENLVDVQFGK